MAPGLDGRASGGDCARIRRIDDFVNMNESAQGLNTHDSSSLMFRLVLSDQCLNNMRAATRLRLLVALFRPCYMHSRRHS